MSSTVLTDDALRAIEDTRQADVVIGIASDHDAASIQHVIRTASAGIEESFGDCKAVIVHSDSRSRDGTREAAMAAATSKVPVVSVLTQLAPAHRLSIPYHGMAGRSSAIHTFFEMASELNAGACVLLDAGLTSITPAWIDRLLRPVLHGDWDLIAPCYYRSKYEGTIVKGIVYPLTRALYGLRVRQPAGSDFGVSQRLIRRYLARDDWETDLARFGTDIWLVTIAVAEGFRIAQSYLGPRVSAKRREQLDLGALLRQVVGSLFALMQQYEAVWTAKEGSVECEQFGVPPEPDEGAETLEPGPLIGTFRRGCRDLAEIWRLCLDPATVEALERLHATLDDDREFHLDDDLWARIIVEFAAAYEQHPLERGHLVGSLAPLYLAWVASFANETRHMSAGEAEARIEGLCLAFERWKAHLVYRWTYYRPAGARSRS